MATPTKYTYTNSSVNTSQLASEIQASPDIIIALQHIDTVETAIDVWMKDALSTSEETALSSIVSAHVAQPEANVPTPVEIVSGLQRDAENAPIQRLKMAPTGWTYQLRATEFESSVIGSLVNQRYTGEVIGDCTLKFYDAFDAEITTQQSADSDCVRTVLDWEPSYEYEIIGGMIKFLPDITEDVRLSVVAVPDIPAASGGSKTMVCNANLKFIDSGSGIVSDGRVTKRMVPDATNHTNKLRIIINHPPGKKIAFSLLIEHFKL